MELIILAALVALLIFGLERNRARQTANTHPHLAGSTDIHNRDAERILCELNAR